MSVRSPDDPASGAWYRLAPLDLAGDRALVPLARVLSSLETQDLLDECESTGEYPVAVLDRLIAAGLPLLSVDPAEAALPPVDAPPVHTPPVDSSSAVTLWHATAISYMAARFSGSLAITLGVSSLALLPVYLGASDELLASISGELAEGNRAALLLTEIAHGSDLVANETSALRVTGTDDFKLNGAKELINGGTHHNLLVVLVRTSTGDKERGVIGAAGDFSLLLVRRTPGVESLERFPTLPARAADISGVRFTGAIVPANRLIGLEGDGFAIVQDAFAISRAGVSGLAAGAAGRATSLATSFARERVLYGRPIVEIDVIADHLAEMKALELVAAALSLKAVAMLNTFGPAAVHYGGLAKLACCELAEETTTLGRRVMGASALRTDLPFERIVRDVTLYGVFDGTSHVVAEQIHWRLARTSAGYCESEHTMERMAQAYTTAPKGFRSHHRARATDSAKRSPRRRPLLLSVDAHCFALAAISRNEQVQVLATLAQALVGFVGTRRAEGRWEDDQGVRFESARLLARIEALIAGAELADPQCRAALGLGDVSDSDAVVYRFGLAWLGARIAGDLKRLWLRTGTGGAEAVEGLVEGFVCDEGKYRENIREQLRAMSDPTNIDLKGTG